MRPSRPTLLVALALALGPAAFAQPPPPPPPPGRTAEPPRLPYDPDVYVRPVFRDDVPQPPVAAPVRDPLAPYASDSEYQYREHPRGPSLWARFKAWLGQKLMDLLSEVRVPENATRLVVVGLALVVLFGLAKLFGRYGMGGFSRRGRRADGAELGEALPERLDTLDLDAWLREALAAGDLRRAVRAVYLRTLQHLAAKGLVVYRAKATNADYLRVLPPPVRDALAPLARRFEELWYGDYPVRDDDADRAQAQEAAVRAAARRAAPTGDDAPQTAPVAEAVDG